MTGSELKSLIKRAGGGAAIAAALNLKSRQAAYMWTRVPSDHVLVIERLSGVPRHRIRPDLYPAEREAEAAQ